MDIKTKYDPGQSVFYIDNNQVNESVINRIFVEVEEKRITYQRKINVSYYLFNSNRLYEERNLFPTKEELLKSL